MTALLQQQETRATQTTQARPERKHNRRTLLPVADIYETPDSIVLLADMPGVSEENVNITLERDVLTIEGSTSDAARQGYKLAYAEFDGGDFRRVFTLSTEVDRDKISATMKDGVLELVLPKAEPAKARKIVVRAS